MDVKVQAILLAWCNRSQKTLKADFFVSMQASHASHASQADGTIINADGSRTLPDGTRVLVGDHI
jgi:hypothetical protein